VTDHDETPALAEETRLDLEGIAARAAAAAPGPWETRDVGYVFATVTTACAAESGYTGTPIVDTFMWPEHGSANQAFIAHVREDVPALVDEVRRLRAVISNAAIAVERAHDVIVFGSHDWSRNKRDAMLYGVLVGWNDDDKPGDMTLVELGQQLGWMPQTAAEVDAYHQAILQLVKVAEELT
jgi:hypothetical protein